ncbi:hypothetical protein Poli38472_014270 [Pythium oligandrum]|uniref:BZIP domain-containing protein n=1 Tax=Pythium oligandrum TaxID=41045 RepID=A0A8K1FN01_PYTOL|nr:hypothetical protein Poli38472_014270 [Pythium oligandrum]|eukprot:TMW64153.1 hypothetical protein Poli38472_014270 [Pythium oligandrum]
MDSPPTIDVASFDLLTTWLDTDEIVDVTQLAPGSTKLSTQPVAEAFPFEFQLDPALLTEMPINNEMADALVVSKPARRERVARTRAKPTKAASSSGSDSKSLATADDLRREKNREKVRRHYYRKLTLLDSLRNEVAELEAHHRRLKTLKQSNGSPTSVTAITPVLQQQFTQLQSAKATLEREQAQLWRLHMEHTDRYGALRELLVANRDLFMSSQMAKTVIKPFSREECYRVRDKAVEDIIALGYLTSKPRRGNGVAGWQDEVVVEQGFFKFSVHKTFENSSPADLAGITFSLITNPEALMRRVYSAALETKNVLVQQIDEDNMVFFQEYRAMDTTNEFVLMKTLYLASRVRRPDGGYILLMRGLGQDRLEDKELFVPSSGEFAHQIVWHDIFSWIKFEPAGLYGEDCASSFYGICPTVGANVEFWAIEVLTMALRWECFVHGPPQILPSTESPVAPTSPSSSRVEQVEGSPVTTLILEESMDSPPTIDVASFDLLTTWLDTDEVVDVTQLAPGSTKLSATATTTHSQSAVAVVEAFPFEFQLDPALLTLTEMPTTSDTTNVLVVSKPVKRERAARTRAKLTKTAKKTITSNCTSNNSLTTADELRRKKNREKVRRHYYRKLTLLDSLRNEVAELEAHHRRLKTLKQSNGSPTSVTAITPVLQQQFTQLQSAKATLEREQAQLWRLHMEHTDRYGALRELLVANRDLFMSSQMAKTVIKPFSREECYRVRDKAVEDIIALGYLTSKPRRGNGVAGWQDEVVVEQGFFKFSVRKTFAKLSPADLAAITFGLITDPEVLMHRVYSAALEAKVVLVQQIDEDNVVLFQEYRAMDTTNEFVLMKTLYLASRVCRPDGGYILLMRGLGQDRLEDKELFVPSSGELAHQIVWHDIFCWIKFEPAGLYGEDCTTSFYGFSLTVGTNVAFWAIEVLSMALRWECFVCGPPQVLPPSDSPVVAASASSSRNEQVDGNTIMALV